ncbi:BatD family protein [Sansalvadorimonas sp. 2012CJ34-2]|uniref:BatD family protein n=1 Tax=Parendozoicomonas callyspongiae TaxID=2942213 RepID=A0ABT0PEI0_9GAMM|nr:BatD family protein [Sansalvadorimonas sp. 2012CJ34-2]MCL6269775.1 BatD family protein [Sansalvadorimonas sp. 2012CJ34-2]
MVKPIKSIFLQLTPLLALFSSLVFADLSATIDRNVITDGEVVNYTLRSDGQTFSGSPDLSPLEKDFNILNSRQSSQIRMINGRSESWVEWDIALLPKRVGAVTIPSLKHNGDTSNPITIEVRKGSSTQGAPASSPVFMRASIGKDEVWQNQETILTLKIFVRAQFADSPNLTPPETEGAIFKILGEDQNEERIIDGIRYQIITRQYVVTPTRPGTLKIPGQVLTGSILEDDPYGNRSLLRMTRTKPFRITSPEMELKVNPVPASWPSDKPWLPAEEVTISESWSESLNELKAGDSITRTVMVMARGSNSAQIPPLPALNISGMRSYPDQPTLDDKRDVHGAFGTRSESTAIVPTRGGRFSVPAIDITWFNTKTGQVEVSRLEGQQLNIKAGSAIEQTQPAPSLPQPSFNETPATKPESVNQSEIIDKQSLIYWQIATFLLGGLWLITLFAWWRKDLAGKTQVILASSTQTRDVSENEAFQSLLKQCSTDNLPAVEMALIHWGKIHFSNPDIYQASIIIEKIRSSQLTSAWHELQRTKYQQESKNKVSTTQLLSLLKDVRKKCKTKTQDSYNYQSINP